MAPAAKAIGIDVTSANHFFTTTTNMGVIEQNGGTTFDPSVSVTYIHFQNGGTADIITAGGNYSVVNANNLVGYDANTGTFFDPDAPSNFGSSSVYNGSKLAPVNLELWAAYAVTTTTWAIVGGAGIGGLTISMQQASSGNGNIRLNAAGSAVSEVDAFALAVLGAGMTAGFMVCRRFRLRLVA